MNGQVQPTQDTDEMEGEVAAAIEACGGDPRAAIKALLIEQLVQEQRIERLAAALSFGYVRGRIDGMAGQRSSGHGRSPDVSSCHLTGPSARHHRSAHMHIFKDLLHAPQSFEEVPAPHDTGGGR